MGGAPGAATGDAGAPGGVDVISEGEVGVFDWVQLDADSAGAFTDWLDDRGFPYAPEAMDAFRHYVDGGWKFIAFSVDAAQLPGSGATLCGTFGPIAMAFASENPVVPVRIAASDADSLARTFTWRVFAVAVQKLRPVGIEVRQQSDGASGGTAAGGGASYLDAEALFAGALDAGALDRFPALAEMAAEGQRVTALQLRFEGAALDDDFHFEIDPDQDAYQRVEHRTQYVQCDGDGDGGGSGGGCAVAAAPDRDGRPGELPTLALLLALPLLGLRRCRGRRRPVAVLLALCLLLVASLAACGGGDDGDDDEGPPGTCTAAPSCMEYESEAACQAEAVECISNE